MATQVQTRRGTTAQHSTFTGAAGELTVDTDKKVVVVHDGTTAGGAPLLRENGSQNAVTTGTSTAASFIPTSSTAPANGVYLPAANSVAISTNGTGRLFVNSSGSVGIGTSSPANPLHIRNDAGSAQLKLDYFGSSSTIFGSSDLFLQPNGTTAMTLKSGGNVGIGTTSPISRFHVSNSGAEGFEFTPGSATNTNLTTHYNRNGSFVYVANQVSAANHQFFVGASEAVRIDSNSRLLVGTSTLGTQYGTPQVFVVGGTRPLTLSNGYETGTYLEFNTGAANGNVELKADARTGNYPSLLFTVGGSERMRIANNGDVLVAKTVVNSTDVGCVLQASGTVWATRSNDSLAVFNRKTTDGNLIEFQQDGINEGSITVSGTTVSYNGAHLSRWSQIKGIDPHDKTDRPEILRGTVMTNLDDMCDWIDPESGDAQDNEQLNKTKVSDVEGDKNVAGIFQSWDDDDDTWVNDYYLAMTGDFVIRVAAGVSVERGDLLMSAGDGTAKPQDDDIIRSKTIAKVTSTNVSCTYDDGSYCVPCVLMAC